jgi:RimJ/RimL family protein N-acetyltransferase
VILGEGLVIRALAPGDRERWLELLHDPEQRRFGSPAFVVRPGSVEELDTRVTQAATAFAAGEPTALCVADESDPDRFLGVIAWRIDLPKPFLTCDIGYSVHPDARRRGVARRAITTLCRWLTLDDDGPHQVRVQLDHVVENDASCRTAVATGFAREGIRRGFFPLPDPAAPDGVRRHDVCLHGYLPGHRPGA